MSKGTIAVQMAAIMDEYRAEVVEATDAAIDSVSKEAVQKLKNTSPKRPGGGQYAKSWTVKKERGAGGIRTAIVHNAKHYRLTHLLEKGHVSRNQYGTFGRVAAREHIKPVEEWTQTELPNEIERRLK